MDNKSLSILIPARNEMFLRETVVNLLKNIRGNTDIFVGLDGEWSDPPLPDDERVTVVFYGKSIGQRAMTNQLCKLSKAKYVMKIDAHCVVDEGFDVKLMNDMQDDYTIIPTLYNLHAFDWVCIGKNSRSGRKYLYKEELNKIRGCSNRLYQSPTPDKCSQCGGNMERELVFEPRKSRKSWFYRFDKTLHFQYWSELGNRPESQGNVVDTLSAQGSCFMLTRQKYWELDICDEEHGSWGQQGTEVACKTWLSGGRLVTTKNTWYSHMFRTQGGDFGFPYPQSGRQVEQAREYSRNLFLNGKWKLAKYDLQWLLEKFKPVPDWHDNNMHLQMPIKKQTKGVIYYTHNVGDQKMLAACRKQLAKGMKEKHIISGSNIALQFGRQNIVVADFADDPFRNMFEKILMLLKAHDADVIFFAEHDVLYHPSHFDFLPPKKDKYYYNTNVWKVRAEDGFALKVDDCKQLSGLVANRELLIQHFEKKLEAYKNGVNVRKLGFEPGTHHRPERVDDFIAESYVSLYPNIDIRHGSNATTNRWRKDQFRNQKFTQGWTEKQFHEIDGWNITANTFSDFIDMI